MRLNFRSTLLFLCLAVCFVTLTFWSRCTELSLPHRFLSKWSNAPSGASGNAGGASLTEGIDCLINQDYTVPCRREGDEIYVPFSFLHDYFEVFGALTTSAKGPQQQFEWSHSNAKVNYPKGPYDPRGIFMYFENYNVETRDRVKCISATEGVPVSTQWEPQGYYYPTQIAQFGLSHFSKNLTEPEPRRRIIEDGDENVAADWTVPSGSNLSRALVRELHTTVLQFETGARYESAVVLALDHVLDLVLGVDVSLRPNSSMTVTVQNRESRRTHQLHYIVSDLVLTVQVSVCFFFLSLRDMTRFDSPVRRTTISIMVWVKMRRNGSV